MAMLGSGGGCHSSARYASTRDGACGQFTGLRKVVEGAPIRSEARGTAAGEVGCSRGVVIRLVETDLWLQQQGSMVVQQQG